jgi:hypothetical protein
MRIRHSNPSRIAFIMILCAIPAWVIAASPLGAPPDAEWTEAARLRPADWAETRHLVYGLSVSGDRVIVGASVIEESSRRGLPKGSGAAWIYRLDGANWIEEAVLRPDEETAREYFGCSVAISGRTAIIGAPAGESGLCTMLPGDRKVASVGGSACVFHFDGSKWVHQARLAPAGKTPVGSFGWSVSLSGDRAVIGAREEDANGWMSGAAYVFRFDGGKWVQEARLVADDGAAGDYFGNGVSISGERILIGAPFDDDHASQSGSAYVFRYDGSTWVEEAKLVPPEGAFEDRFGRSVSLSGDTALIGAYWDDKAGFDAGSAYVYHFDGSGWKQQARLLPSAGTPHAHPELGCSHGTFGSAVSVCGDRALIGAELDYEKGEHAGSAYVFRFDGST